MAEFPDEMYERPEQALTVQEFHAILMNDVPEPPRLLLMLKVEHEDTKQSWLQQSEFSRIQIEALAKMLVHICKERGIAYEQEPDD